MFTSARIKLTAWYLIVIMVISISFSAVIYQVLVTEVNRFDHLQRSRLERRYLRQYEYFSPTIPLLPPQASYWDTDLVQDVKDRLMIHLLIVNSSIFMLSGILGFLLAGQTLAPIQKMVQKQHRFISDASHELKTPLTSLKSAFEIFLRDPKRTLKDSDLLAKESIEEVNKLQFLSESLLELSTHEYAPHSSKKTVLLSEILLEAIKKTRVLATEKNIVIEYESRPFRLPGNIEHLTRLFVILLDNAIKYSPSQTTIHIRTQKKTHWMVIEIQDEGIGIEVKHLPHIFDRFFRVDQSRSKTQTQGYGLGLSIAKNIIVQHSGSIQVQSKFGKGSTFKILLPLESSALGRSKNTSIFTSLHRYIPF